LAELAILNQIANFNAQIQEIYPAGVRFTLVVDNLCALLVNDVPIEKTRRYVCQLRDLIGRVGATQRVDVLVESEHFLEADYRANAPGVEVVGQVSEKDIENVSRFLGRRCSVDEARERVTRYKSVTQISEDRLSSMIDGFHMTQRATPSTFGFRAFPGGDSRIQAGRLGLLRSDASRMRPVLITSRSSFSVSQSLSTRTPVSDLIDPVLLVSNGSD
jgi:hypothetical protein